MIVPILSVAVVIFFGQLSTTSSLYQEQLNSIYENTTITGNYTDLKGKQVGNLVLGIQDVLNLLNTGLIENLTVSTDRPYLFLGTSFLADGTNLNISPFYTPPRPYAFDTAKSKIQQGPNLVATNDIYNSPEFIYSDTLKTHFLDGYNELFLYSPLGSKSSFSCMVPTSLMEENGINLGDTIRIAIDDTYKNPEYNGKEVFRHYDLVVVGSYEKQGIRDTIYVPLSLFFDSSFFWNFDYTSEKIEYDSFRKWFTYDDFHENLPLSGSFQSAHFSLKNSNSLANFKNYLVDYGYTQVHNINGLRVFLVLNDTTFNNSVASVKQQINYIDTLYPFLYILVGIIAIVISYLMVVSRKMEFAIMRGLGTTRTRSFFSFFFEQSFLSLIGISIGFSIWVLIWGIPLPLHLTLSGGFLACYLLGSSISVTIMNHSNVLTILTDKE